MFKRKAYEKLLRWKRDYSNGYAALLEGPRRVGKSTIAKHFAEEEYDSSIIIDFANITSDMLAVFDDVANLDLFFLRLQAQTGITLIPGKSVIDVYKRQRAKRLLSRSLSSRRPLTRPARRPRIIIASSSASLAPPSC